MVSFLEQSADPAAVGFDGDRLRRIERHFGSYVSEGRLPGFAVLVARAGALAHFATGGFRDRERELPVTADTVFRIYSMTKPVTSVAAMMLYEQAAFDLSDRISTYLPEFEHMSVYVGGSPRRPVTERATEPVRIWHLFTHTAGLTYGFAYAHAVDAIYRAAGFEWGTPPGADLAACCEMWARLPLLFEPGTCWNYSVATDVLGRLVEVISGERLDEFFDSRIFGPLGMPETGFQVRPDQLERLAALYMPETHSLRAVRNDRIGAEVIEPPRMLSGGGGLVSTIGDYHRFTQMLLRRGELDGIRLLGSRTVEYMTRNHLPGGHDMAHFGHPITAEAEEGVGFGLGFSVRLDAASSRVVSSEGEFAWGGAASTTFWVDPVEEMTVIFMTQLLPSTTWPLRRELRQLVYQALVE